MKRIPILLLTVIFTLLSYSQSNNRNNLITLKSYIPAENNLSQRLKRLLSDKLSQIVLINGMSGEGFENRFVITANVQEVAVKETATIPVKVSVILSVAIYVGDGVDGTKYSSYIVEVKGVGDDKEGAYAHAFRRINKNDSNLQLSIETGKRRILQYYDKMGPSIIAKAKAAVASKKYADAVGLLLVIPMNSELYSEAQNLIALYGAELLNTSNERLMFNAETVWATSPNPTGADEVQKIISKIQFPSEVILGKIQKLNSEIQTRLNNVTDREWQLERDLLLQTEKNSHEMKMATIKAATEVAKANIANRPQIIYNVHSW